MCETNGGVVHKQLPLFEYYGYLVVVLLVKTDMLKGFNVFIAAGVALQGLNREVIAPRGHPARLPAAFIKRHVYAVKGVLSLVEMLHPKGYTTSLRDLPEQPSELDEFGRNVLEKHAADFLDFVTYRRIDLEQSMVRPHTRTHHAVHPTLFRSFSLRDGKDTSASHGSVSPLLLLPMELRLMVAQHMTIEALFRLGHTGRQGRLFLDSIPDVRTIATNASEAVYVLLRTRVAGHVSLHKLSMLLSRQTCRLCGYFGTVLVASIIDRFCVHCVFSRQGFPHAIDALHATAELGISLKQLQQFTPVPFVGNYPWPNQDEPLYIVPIEPYERLARWITTNKPIRSRLGPRTDGEEMEWQPSACNGVSTLCAHLPTLPASSGSELRVQHGRSCRGCLTNIQRLNGKHPYFNHDFLPSPLRYGVAVQSDADILQHVVRCEHARGLWAHERGIRLSPIQTTLPSSNILVNPERRSEPDFDDGMLAQAEASDTEAEYPSDEDL